MAGLSQFMAFKTKDALSTTVIHATNEQKMIKPYHRNETMIMPLLHIADNDYNDDDNDLNKVKL